MWAGQYGARFIVEDARGDMKKGGGLSEKLKEGRSTAHGQNDGRGGRGGGRGERGHGEEPWQNDGRGGAGKWLAREGTW
jgi:hypothetical protein